MTIPASAQRRGLFLLAAAAFAVASMLVVFQKYAVKPSCIENIAELRYELVCRENNAATCIDDWMWDQRTP